MGETRNAYRILVGKVFENVHVEGRGGGRITLRRILEERKL